MVSLGMISGSKCHPATPTNWGPRPQWTPTCWGIGVFAPMHWGRTTPTDPSALGSLGSAPQCIGVRLGCVYPNALGSTPTRWGMMRGQPHMRWLEFSENVVWRRGMVFGRLAST